MKLLSLLLASLPMMAAAQSQQHLVAHVIYTGTAVDSTQYTYLSNKPAYLPETENWNNDQSSSYGKDGREIGRETRKFDGSGRITELTKKRLNGNATWIDDEQHLYTYNANGNIAVHEVWIYSSAASALGRYAKHEYSYDASGNVQEYIQYNVQNVSGMPTFVPGDRTTYSYTGNQLTQTQRDQYVSGIWKPFDRILHTYPTATTAEELSEYYDGASWLPIAKVLKTLDVNQRVTHSIVQRYTGSIWDNTSSDHYTYNAAGKVLSHESKKWISGVETEDFLSELTYNSDNNILASTYKDWNGTAYTVRTQGYYYYGFPTGVGDAAVIQPAMQVYPVPASNSLHINMAANDSYYAYLYDATGKLAKSVSTTGLCTIDVQDLPVGNYVLQVNNGGNVASKQVVIAR